MNPRYVCSAVAAFTLAACAGGGGSPPPDAVLSNFALDIEVSAYVLENIPGCEVDGLCYLELQFADTTVNAMYGTGERPAPCRITVEASDASFAVETDAVVRLVLTRCGDESLPVIDRIVSG